MKKTNSVVAPRWFQRQLLAWFDVEGRKDLPWQFNRTAYRVWVSEIMLQQTQVATVIPYYERFINRFPDIQRLSAASMDEVLHLWSGLGYYARGRNLHRTAVRVADEYNGFFPDDIELLVDFPGIGRSTAGAILALSGNQHQAILDANVKRVLTRFALIDGWPGNASVQKKLWLLAENYTPRKRVADYTQAIMDLGATLCARSRPACALCPLRQRCQAHLSGRVAEFPYVKPRKSLAVRYAQMLVIQNEKGHILLQKRPPSGIWGGLWSLPEFPDSADVDITRWVEQRLGLVITLTGEGAMLRHTFSHFHLEITPIKAKLKRVVAVLDDEHSLWYNASQPESLGIAAPIKKLLDDACKINNATLAVMPE